MSSADRNQGITLAQAAMIAGYSLLLMMILSSVAEIYIYPTLVVPDQIEQTIANLLANNSLFVAGILCYVITFIGDVVVAWALYILLRPVNPSVSLLAGWFRLVHAVIALAALIDFATVQRVLSTPNHQIVFGSDRLHPELMLLIHSFRYGWGISLVFFGIHLGLLGYLVYKSSYIPKFIGIVLFIAGVCYVIYNLSPYLFPGIRLDYLLITFLGELIFIVWLVIRASTLREANSLKH
ncbi:MAG TPA: DUF4386 domain-containing protein [Acidobacteriota bacterium]|nr:DUF4386 domain-containing protein [Acidobacteriota bacterium]